MQLTPADHTNNWLVSSRQLGSEVLAHACAWLAIMADDPCRFGNVQRPPSYTKLRKYPFCTTALSFAADSTCQLPDRTQERKCLALLAMDIYGCY